MNENERLSDIEKEEKENIRVGYQVAVELWKLEREQTFARFGVMLLANSIIATLIALVMAGQFSLSKFPVAQIYMAGLIVFLSVMGIILCIVSFLITVRGYDYQNYYVTSAREIEEEYLLPRIQTVSRGHVFAHGGRPEFHLKDYQRRSLSWHWPWGIQPLLWLVIGFFDELYFLFIGFQCLYSLLIGFQWLSCHFLTNGAWACGARLW